MSEHPQGKTEKPKFIIDVDTGVDDAMALLIALSSHKKGEIEILAITTVAGNTTVDNVIRNTFRTLEVAKCENIPVYRGSEQALVIERDALHSYHGSDGFNDLKFDWEPDVSRLKEESANSAIHRLAQEYPKQITFIALAPLTNLALAMRTDPRLASSLKEIFLMGGNSEGIGNASIVAEFNFHADPEAAYVVLNSVKCPTYIVTWEMCFKYVKPSMEWRRSVLGTLDTPEANLMNPLEYVWFNPDDFDPEHWVLCDQFVVIAALDKSAITASRNAKATVELSGHFSRGNMILEQRFFVVNREGFKTNVILIDNMDNALIQKYMLRAFGVDA